MSWPVSGELIVMLVIGGLGTITGPIVGAIAFLVMEEFFKGLTQHWMLIMGPVIVVIALLTRNGFAWLIRPREASAPAPSAAPAAAPKVAAVSAGESQ
jgi:branched-chain amino acid transport system permease protein